MQRRVSVFDQMAPKAAYDFIVVGAGSAGCAVAAGLTDAGFAVMVIEAGPSDAHPLVKMPFGLIWVMGSKRDWQFKSAPMAGVNGRQIKIPRGRMLGGSSSINSMVWFRGLPSDFDAWHIPGWGWADVEPAFEAVEARMRPARMQGSHPLVQVLGAPFGANTDTPPDPARESGGTFRFNMKAGRRWSAADAFLRPAQRRGLTVVTGKQVMRLVFDKDRARGVTLTDGSTVKAEKGVVLSAGAIGSPAILLASGIGPGGAVVDAPEVGENLHDHPGVGLHFAGPRSGYGLSLRHALGWLAAPFQFALGGRGLMNSPTVEGGMFFAASGQGAPDMQSHFIPFYLNHAGSRYAPGEGYFADVCVCQPKSRGRLRLVNGRLEIDLGLFSNTKDLALMVQGIRRLRELLDAAPLDPHRAPEVHPGRHVESDEALGNYIRGAAGTAYHPVGTVAMGGPLNARLAVKGVGGLWVADASIMPRITSANTNAPCIMIGHRAAHFIKEDAA